MSLQQIQSAFETVEFSNTDIDNDASCTIALWIGSEELAEVMGKSSGLDAVFQIDESNEKLNIHFRTDKHDCLLYTSPSPRDATLSRMPSSA